MKNVMSLVVTFAGGALVAFLALRMPEEKLRFTLSEPAAFGDVIYQNLTVENRGWDPAENIGLSCLSCPMKPENIKSSASLITSSVPHGVFAVLPRLRRQETAVIALSYSGRAISAEDISIKSDRSVAEAFEPTEGWRLQWGSFWVGVVTVFVAIIVFGGGIHSFLKAEAASKARACRRNLIKLDAAKTKLAEANHLHGREPVTQSRRMAYLEGSTFPECPSGGKYFLNTIGVQPGCSVHGKAFAFKDRDGDGDG